MSQMWCWVLCREGRREENPWCWILQTLIFDVADVSVDVVDIWCWALCRVEGGSITPDVGCCKH
jgi:hypothetical protein